MTRPTLSIGGSARIGYVHDRTFSVKRNSVDVTLVDAPSVPALSDAVAITDPTWAGIVTGCETTAYDDGTLFAKVTATNEDVLADGGAAAFALTDGPPANYSDLVVSRTLNEGVEEVRARLRTMTAGLSPGEEIELTSAAEGYSSEVFTLMDITTTWPTADNPVYELDLGLGDFETATTGGLDPPTLKDVIHDECCDDEPITLPEEGTAFTVCQSMSRFVSTWERPTGTSNPAYVPGTSGGTMATAPQMPCAGHDDGSLTFGPGPDGRVTPAIGDADIWEGDLWPRTGPDYHFLEAPLPQGLTYERLTFRMLPPDLPEGDGVNGFVYVVLETATSGSAGSFLDDRLDDPDFMKVYSSVEFLPDGYTVYHAEPYYYALEHRESDSYVRRKIWPVDDPDLTGGDPDLSGAAWSSWVASEIDGPIRRVRVAVRYNDARLIGITGTVENSTPGEFTVDRLVWCWDGEYPTGFLGDMYGPVYVATADGITSVFTLPAYPGGGYVAGTLGVLVDGMWQPATETDPATGEFDLGPIPDEGDLIYASWRIPA